MVNGPPCPQCGFTLRWLAPQNGWGCDRCQQMFAPQQVQPPAHHTPTPQPPTPTAYPPTQPPQQAYAPHGQGYGAPPYSPQPQGYPPHAPPPPAGKSRKGLVIGLSLAGLAIAGGVIAVVLVMRGKGSAAGGSRDDVLRATFAAMAAGDASGLVDLSGVEAFYAKAIECKPRDKDDDARPTELEDELRDPKKMHERAKKAAAKTVLRTKGVKIEIVEILTKEPKPLAGDEKQSSNKKQRKKSRDDDESDDDEGGRDRDSDDDERSDDERDTKTFVMKKGKEIAPGCKVKETFRFQTVKVKLKITEGSNEPFDHVAQVGLTNIAGGWYLSEPSPIPVGFDALAADLEPWRERMCKCSDEACATSTGEELEKEYGHLERLVGNVGFSSDDDLEVPKERTAKLRKVLDEVKECAGKAAGGAVVAKMTELKDAMCACKDKACADKVVHDMTEYSRTQSHDKAPSGDLMNQITQITKEMTECMMKLMTPAAALTSISPATGAADGASEITLTGTGFFSSVPISVYFGTQRGTILRTESDSALRVLAPRLLPGGETVVDVVVNMADGKELRLPKAYTYEAAEDPLPPEDVTIATKLAPAKNLPPACERYRLAIARTQACAKYPEGAKAGFSTSWESLIKMDKTWGSQRSSVKKSITDTCEMGAKTMNDALRSMGC